MLILPFTPTERIFGWCDFQFPGAKIKQIGPPPLRNPGSVPGEGKQGERGIERATNINETRRKGSGGGVGDKAKGGILWI